MKKLILVLIAMLAISHFLHAEDTVKVVWEKKDSFYNNPLFNTKNSKIFCNDDYGFIGIRNVLSGEIENTIQHYNKKDYLSLCANIVTDSFIIAASNNNLIIINSNNFDTIKVIHIPFDYMNSSGLKSFISQDYQNIIIAAADAGVLIYETTTWQLIKQITKYPYYPKEYEKPHVDYAIFFPDGKRIAFASQFTFIYDLEKDSIIKQLDGIEPIITNDGKYIATSYYNNKIMLHSAINYEKVKEFDIPNTIFKYNFSKNSKYFITSNIDNDVTIWKLENLSIYNKCSYPIRNFDISNDNKFLVSGVMLFRILWDTTSLSVPEHQDESLKILNCYPNPATESIIVEYNALNTTQLTIKLLDILGNTLYQTTKENITSGTHQEIIQTTNYPNGEYFVTLEQNGKTAVYKLVKE